MLEFLLPLLVLEFLSPVGLYMPGTVSVFSTGSPFLYCIEDTLLLIRYDNPPLPISHSNISEQNVTKNYIGESPKTQELGEDSPGNIGTFTGMQIVKKYIEKFPATTLAELMKTGAGEIYNKAKYKPRS